MDIGSILQGNKSSSPEHYWALTIEPGWVQAGIWFIEGTSAKVVSVSPPAAWKENEEIVGAADTVLSAAIQKLPDEIPEPSKTVFGVPPSWVGDGEIKAEHLGTIKRICTELSLEPTGFVVLPEAIAHLTKSQEGAPLNAVVLGVGEENIEVSVFRLGNLVGNALVARSVSISDDVVEGLARFGTTENLPSRFILYDGKEGELEEDRQTLLKMSWESEERIKFLHTPKIEIIDSENKVLATALAGASEMGGVTKVESEEIENYQQETKEIENVEVPQETINPEDLGFSLNEDILEKRNIPVSSSVETVSNPVVNNPPTVQSPAPIYGEPKKSIKDSILGIFPKKLNVRVPNVELTPTKNIFITGIAVFVLLLVGLFAAWWFIPKADITLIIASKKLEDNIKIDIDTNSSKVSVSDKTIPGNLVTEEDTGERTKSTTGTKLVGERAKGTVKILNGTENDINLAAGTAITSSGGLKYSIVSAVSIVAAVSTTEPGSATAEVVASDIGDGFNLAGDEKFKVSNYPKADVEAVSTSAFTGGSSREINAVSKEDQEALEEELLSELTDKVKTKLQNKLPSDKYLADGSVMVDVKNSTFSAKVGDEATTLKLTMDVEASALTIDKKTFFDFAKELLKERVPSGYVLKDEQIGAKFEVDSEDEGVYVMDTILEANLLPDVNTEELAKKIKGRTKQSATEYFSTIPGFRNANIRISVSFPDKIQRLPHVEKNIDIELSAEK